MPLVTVQNWIKQQLDGLIVPGPANVGPLEAFIAPPDPNEGPQPAAYIWPNIGHERRQTMPRNTGPGTGGCGWKEIRPDIDVYLTWFNSADDPYLADAFPSVVDAVMAALRTSPDPAQVVDPNSGLVCNLVGVGEDMSWQALGVATVRDQGWQRFDALIIVPFIELVQA